MFRSSLLAGKRRILVPVKVLAIAVACAVLLAGLRTNAEVATAGGPAAAAMSGKGSDNATDSY